MKAVFRHLGVILMLCSPVAATAQIRYSDPANRDRAKEMGLSAQRTIKTKEPKWKLKDVLESEFGFHQYFKSGNSEAELSIYVYDSPEEASRQLGIQSRGSSVTGPEPLKDIGDEAFYMSHRYFSWIGVRKGRMVVVARGPGPELTITTRFVQYGLEQLATK